jgi:hypothetical protein
LLNILFASQEELFSVELVACPYLCALTAVHAVACRKVTNSAMLYSAYKYLNEAVKQGVFNS